MKIDIPDADAAEFSNLKDETRSEIHALLRAIGRLLDVKKGLGKSVAAEAFNLGLSAKTMYRHFDNWRNGCTRKLNGEDRTFKKGDWRMLINFAKEQPVAQTLPRAFVDFWKMILEKNQRKTKPAWRCLKRGYHARRWIFDGKIYDVCPGYEHLPTGFPPTNGTGLPHGWSYSNLLNYQSTSFEKSAMREGLGVAIAKHVPKILHTRVGLYVGSHYSFDDVLRDMKALLISRNQQVRVQELGAMDFFSAHRFAVHRRPQYRGDDDRVDNVKEREMRFLLAGVLRYVGYSPRGTEMIVERGTATIREDLEDFLRAHSNEKISVRRAGITGREQALKCYFGDGKGNPQHKALHESLHNLLQNEAAHLPAPTGHDRTPPEWLFGIEAVTENVCKSIARLLQDPDPVRRERAQILFAPMCEYWQLLDLLRDIDGFIGDRTDHKIEGWEKCGHTCVEYRRDAEKDEWLSTSQFLALPPADQSLIAAAASADPRYRRPRKLAPREVFARGSSDLIRFPDHVIALMFADDRLGEDLREEKMLTPDGQFDIANQLAGPERMRFAGGVMTPKGEIVRLNERERYGVVLNPWDAVQLWIYDRKGAFLGTAPRVQRLSLHDDHTKALGNREHTVATLLKPLRERHANAAREFALIEKRLNDVNGDEPITAAEKLHRERERLRTQPATRFLESENDETTVTEKATKQIRPASDFL